MAHRHQIIVDQRKAVCIFFNGKFCSNKINQSLIYVKSQVLDHVPVLEVEVRCQTEADRPEVEVVSIE